jgi:hypothetical protein
MSEVFTSHERDTTRREELTPRETLHAWCHYCVQNRSDDAVRDCGGDFVTATGRACPFYSHRLSTGRISVKLLRRLCVEECMGGSPSLVADCSDTACILFPYRMGKSPTRTGKGHHMGAEALRQYRKRADDKGISGQSSTISP